MRCIRLNKAFAAVFVLAFASSCVLLQPQVPNAVVENKYADATAGDVLRKVQRAYTDAEKTGLSFFARDQYNKGKVALATATRKYKYKEADIEVLKYLFIAEQQLNICVQVKNSAEQKIPQVLAGLTLLKYKQAEQSYASEYDGLLHDTSKLLSSLEATVLGKPVNPSVWNFFDKQKQTLIKNIQALEIKVVKYNALNESKIVFEEVEKINAASLAPTTYRQAEKTLEEANEIIEKNVKDEKAIQEAGNKYKFAVYHALHVAREVDKLESLGSYEDYILDMEDKLNSIAEALKYRDIRNHALYEQIQLLSGLVKRLVEKKSNVMQASTGLTSVDQVAVAKLESEKQEALKQIEELSQQLSQLKEQQPEGDKKTKVVLSDKEKEFRRKARILEQRVSELVLENNNLKSERDSLKNKLKAK